MIDVESKVIIDCDFCSEKIDSEIHDSPTVFCDECIEKIPVKEMIETMEKILKDKEWENHDGYIGFENEDQKKQFMLGLRSGMCHAFFWYANMYGDDGVHAFERIYHLFEFPKKDIK